MSIAMLWRFFYFAWFGSEIVIAIATRTRHSTGNVRDRGTFLMLWVVIAASITASIWFANASTIGAIPNAEWMRPVALAVLIAGLAMRWAAIVTLGRSFSSNVAIHSTQTVHKTGLYRWMRHPSYTGTIIIFIAVGLYNRNWISLLIVVVPTTAALMYRIHVEEMALRGHFGEEYIAYSRQTKRLIPGIY